MRIFFLRLTSIDALRGIAILGILFMNMPFHNNIYLGYVPFEPALLGDQIMGVVSSIFADGRFRTLFCLLFGAGIAIQYESFKKQKLDPMIFFKSRLNWLILFGFLHAVFLFGGDILMLYGITGFLLIKGIALTNDEIIKKAKFHLILGSILMLCFAAIIFFFPDPSSEVVRGSDEYLEAVELWYGNYPTQMAIQGGFAIFLIIISPFSMLWQTLGLMYLGVYLYRTDFFSHGFESGTLKKVVIAAIVSTALCVSPQILISDFSLNAVPILSSVSAIFVSLLYAHIVVKLSCNQNRLIAMFIAPGKIAFSLYITQSFVMAILLRWIMPEFNFTATLFDYFMIALAFTAVQLIAANIYVSKCKQGPLEQLWRKLYLNSARKKQAQFSDKETSQIHD